SRFSMETAITQTEESNAFICTECGGVFTKYYMILAHMSRHVSYVPSSGSSKVTEFPKEYVLQENGTLTMINGSQSANVPSPTLSLASPLHPSDCNDAAGAKHTVASLHLSSCNDAAGAKPTAASLRPSLCNDVVGSKPSTASLHLSSCKDAGPVQNTGRGFECTLCFQIFWSREELRKHLPNHSQERFYCCGLCGKRFLTLDSLNMHRKENHIPPKAKLFCKVENQGHKNEKTYPCKKCGSVFFWFTDFQTHSLYHCNGLKEVKKHCKKLEESHEMGKLNGTSSDFKTLASSPEVTDNASDCQSYQCGLCGDRFNKLVALKEHHLIHQTQEEIDQLNQEARITFSRSTHMTNTMQERGAPVGSSNRSSSVPARLYPCKQCNRVFNHSSSLSRHMRSHKKTMHKCPFCKKLFPQHCDVAKHKNVGLKSLGTGVLQTEFSCKDPEGLQEEDQVQTSSVEKKAVHYQCSECNQSFTDGLLLISHLEDHGRVEQEKNRNTCPECGKVCNNGANLDRHMKAHGIDKTYPCLECSKRFPTLGNSLTKQDTCIEYTAMNTSCVTFLMSWRLEGITS
uniref:C2H2-type domain-containing protein n=1 Tax=Gadus morhua TaxID=8049 RepID=A0A8C5B8J8_GADMO